MNEIKAMRMSLGLSQAKFADRYGIPKRTIENWESEASSAPGYVEDLLKRRVLADQHVALMSYVFEEYKDKGGHGSTEEFPTAEEAIAYAQREWDHLTPREQRAYREDPAGLFHVVLCEVEWDEDYEEYLAGEPIKDIKDFIEK